MALQILQNFYKATVSTAWAAGTGNRYVSVLPTPSSGRLVVNPSDISKREIVSYSATGTDAGGTYITLSARGVGGTTDQIHAVNETVRQNLTAQHYSDIQTELDLKLDDTQLDTDGTLAANSDTKIPSQKAVKTYSDAITTNVTTLNSQNVKLTGDQTITTGVKTFVVSPIVPTPTTNFQAATKAYADGLAIAGSPDSSTTVKGIGRVSVAPVSAATPIFVGDNDGRVPTQAENDALVGTGTPSTSNPYVSKSTLRFGGTGSDGALAISSGTTSIDLGAAQVVVKNYTSVSITGTGALTFTNPHTNGTIIIIKSQGDMILTSSAAALIDASGMGASGGAAGPAGAGSGARGGSGLYIECAGAWNFTGTIKNNGADATASTVQSGGNGGGGPGTTLILYGSLTANSGTSTVTAGTTSSIVGAPFVSLATGAVGTTSYGFFNQATGGAASGSTPGAILYPTIYSRYSKTIYVIPGAGGGGGGLAVGPTYLTAGVGGSIGTSTIALNTEFV